jgi:hypothetical protein
MTDLAALLDRLADVPLAPLPSVADLHRRNRKRHRRSFLRGAAGALAAGVAAVLGITLAIPSSSPPSGSGLASYLVPATKVPLTVLRAVGIPSTIRPPQALSGQPQLDTGTKPEIFYAGAAFCPYCAVSRWALVIALSEFGTFSNLGAVVSSASNDIYPGLKSWSFAHSHYSSPYLAFDPVELSFHRTGAPTPGQATGYVPVATLSLADRHLYDAYDAGGTIPFIDIANAAVVVGSSADPAPLQGLSLGQISSTLSDPSSPVAEALDGAANTLIKSICTLPGTAGAPACAAPLLQKSGIGGDSPGTSSTIQVGQYLGAAAKLLAHTASWNAPTELTRLSVPGPDGTTLLVGSASSNSESGCEALAARGPGSARQQLVGAACGFAGTTSQLPTKTTPRTTFGDTTHGWLAPTGALYAISFGQGPAGTSMVAYVTSSGSTVVKGAVDQGWYEIAVPSTDLAKGGKVDFYATSGRLVGTGPLSAAG